MVVGGCAHVARVEQEPATEPSFTDYLHALPEGYFAHYFPVGASTIQRDQAVATFDPEHEYIELSTKNTVSGTAHWAMKVLKTNEGEDLLLISDMIQNEVSNQRLYVVEKNQAGEWSDRTQEYFDGVMGAAAQLNLKERVTNEYPAGEVGTKLKNAKFIFSPESPDIIAGIGNVWQMEFPLYIITWDGNSFMLSDTVPGEQEGSTDATDTAETVE